MPTKEQIKQNILAIAEENKKSGLKGQDLYSSILTTIINGKVDIGLSTEFALDKMKPIEEYRLFVDTASMIINDCVTVEEVIGEPLGMENINKAKADVANIVYNNEKVFAYREKTEEDNKKSLSDDLKVFEDNQKKLLKEYESEDPLHDFNSFFKKAKEIADFEGAWASISANPEFKENIATKAEQDRQKANEKINEFCSLYNLSSNSNSVEKCSDITLLCHIVKSGDKDRAKAFFDAKMLLNKADANKDAFKDSAKKLNDQFIKMADADYYKENKNQIIKDISDENIKIYKDAREKYAVEIKESLKDAAAVIKNGLELFEKDKAAFFTFNHISEYSRAIKKYDSMYALIKENFSSKVNGGFNSAFDYAKHYFPDECKKISYSLGFEISVKAFIREGKLVEKLTDKILEDIDDVTLKKINENVKNYVYSVDNEKNYKSTYAEHIETIEPKVDESTILTEEEKKKFEEISVLIKQETSLNHANLSDDESILDVVATHEGYISREYIDSLNLPFQAYLENTDDILVNSLDPTGNAKYYAYEMIQDEMWIEKSTQEDILAVINKAEELGLMDDAIGGESGGKNYGLGKYLVDDNKLRNLLEEGKTLTDPEKIAMNAKLVTVAAENFKETKDKYEQLLDFIGDKFGEGLSANIFSNRQPRFPKEWRTSDRNRQMAQFNAICQLVSFSKELNIPLEKMVSSPVTEYKKYINSFHEKKLTKALANETSLGKKMAGYLVERDSDFPVFSYRFLEALAKLEKKPELRAHNAIVSSFTSQHAIHAATNPDTEFIADYKDTQNNIRNIFLVGDKLHDLSNASTLGYNVETGSFPEVNYKEGIKNKEATPQQELDNILQAVADYSSTIFETAVTKDPETSEVIFKKSVTNCLGTNYVRYQAQQYFADYVIQKGFKKGSPEFKLLEDYIADPVKVENDYRAKKNLPLVKEEDIEPINDSIKDSQLKNGNRFDDLEAFGKNFANKHEKSDQKLVGFYKDKKILTDKIFAGKGTEADEEKLLSVNKEISTLTATLSEELKTGLDNSEITQHYYDQRIKMLESGDFSKKAELMTKEMTFEQYIKMPEIAPIDPQVQKQRYDEYLNLRHQEILDLIEARDNKKHYLRLNLNPYQVEQRAKINKLAKQNKELSAKETELDKFLGTMDKSINKAKESSKVEDIKAIAENYNKANAVLLDIDKVTPKNKHFENLVIDSKKLNDDKFFKAMEDTLHLSAVSQEGKDSECLMFAKIVQEGNAVKINAFVEIAKNRHFAKDEIGPNSFDEKSLNKMTSLMENLVTAEGETLQENINQIANYKKEINGKAKEILGKTIMDEMADSFKIIKDNVALLDGKNKADFFAYNNLSKYSRAMSKWYALVDPLKFDFKEKINTDTKNLSDYVIKNFPEGVNLKFGDPTFIMSLNPSSLMQNGKIVEKLTQKLISEADTETIVKMKDVASKYIYPVDDEKFYKEQYGKNLDAISAKIKNVPISKEEKENFDKAVEFLKKEKSFENNKLNYDENILDAVADCEGILSKDYVDSLNLPFNVYDTTKEDMTINMVEHQAEDFAAEYVYDEMWIEESTQNDIKAVILKATELGLMENAAGGESGSKEYGFAEYSKCQTKLNDLIDNGNKLTKPEEIAENIKNITKASEELKECKDKYEELFNFIGNKFGEGMSGNVFSNRQANFPKEWRTGDRNRQMAQFNAICQITYFTKEMNIPLDEMLSDPITSYRKSINSIHNKLLEEQFNAKESLGKKMAGYLITKDSYEGQYMGISGRMLEALTKLEKKPENKIHNNMVSTFVTATYSLRMDKDAISNFTNDDPNRMAQYNIRNIFLVGDKTYDLSNAAPDGYNPIEGKFSDVNYYEGIKNKEATPQQELDNILKAVIEYGPAADKIILVEDPETGDKELAENVSKYLNQSEIRYHAQQYFADYVILKGYKKGSPEYKLLEDYMEDPAKVENEYRKKNGLKKISISESDVNVDVKICQEKLGNRFAEYENPGVTFITKHEKQDQSLKDFYKSKTKLTDKVFNGNGTEKDETELEKVNNDIAKLTASLTEELTSAFEKGEITERYYNDRMNNLVTGDFSKKATMFEKTFTKSEFAKLGNNANLSKQNLTASYNAYLESKNKEKLDFIKERDQKQYYVSKKLTPYQVEQRAKLKTLSNQYNVLQNKEASLNKAIQDLDKLSKEIKTNNVDSIKNFVNKYEEINGLRNEINNLPGKNKHFENLVSKTGKLNDSVFKNIMENTLNISMKQIGGKSEADLLVKLSKEKKDEQIGALIDAAMVRKQAIEVSDKGLEEHCSLLISQISPDDKEWEKNKSNITQNIISNKEVLKIKMSDEIVKMISEEKDKLDLIYAKYDDKEEFYKINNTYEIAKSFEKIGQFTENYDVVNHFDKISTDGTKDCVDIIKKKFPDSNVNSLIFARKNPDRNINALKIIVPASEEILSHMNYDSVAKCYNNMKNWTFSIENSKEYTLSGEKSISELKKNGSLLPLTKNEKEKLSSSLDYLENNLLLASNKVTDTDENLINEEVTLKEAKYAKEEAATENFPNESVMPGMDFAFKSQLADFESITPYIGQEFVLEEKTRSNILEVIEKAEELGILDSNGSSEQINKGYGFSKYLETFAKAQKAVNNDAKITDSHKKAENAKEIIKASNELESINKKYDELIEFIGDRFGDSLAGNIFTNREKEFPKRFREKAAKQCGQFNAIAQIYMCCKSEGIDIKEFLTSPVQTAYNKTVESKESYSKNVLHNDLNSTGKRMAYFLTDHTNISSLNDIKKSTINIGFNSNSLMRGLEAIVKLDTNPNNKAHNTVLSAAARLLPAMAGYRSNDIFGNHIENGKQYDSKKYIKNIFAINNQNEIKDIGNASPYYYNISDRTAKNVDYVSEIKDNENTPKEEVNKVMGIISDYSDEIAKAVKEAKDLGVYGGNISVGEIIYHAHEYLADYMIYNQIVPGTPEYEQINYFFEDPVASINEFRKEKGQGPLSGKVIKEFKDELDKNGSRLNLIDGTIEDADHQINLQLKAFSDRKNELLEMLAENPDNEKAENELMLISQTVNGIITNRINEINNLPDSVSQLYKDERIKAYENEDFSESKYQDFRKAYYEDVYNNISSDDYDNNYMMPEGLAEKQKEAREKNIVAANERNKNLEEMNEFLQGVQSFADDNIAINQIKDYFMLQDEITLSEVAILISDIAKGKTEISGIEKGDITKDEDFDRIYSSVKPLLIEASVLDLETLSNKNKEEIKDTAITLFDPEFTQNKFVLSLYSDHVKDNIDVIAASRAGSADLMEIAGAHDIKAASQATDEFAGKTMEEKQNLMIHKVAQMVCGEGYYPNQPTEALDMYSEDELINIQAMYMQELLDFTATYNKVEPHKISTGASFGANFMPDDFKPNGKAYQRVKDEMVLVRINQFIKYDIDNENTEIYNSVMLALANGTIKLDKKVDVFDDAQFNKIDKIVKEQLGLNGINADIPETIKESTRDLLKVVQDPNRATEDSFVKGFGPDVTDYYDVRKSFRSKNQYNSVGAGNVYASVKVIKDLTSAKGKEEREAIIVGYFADLLDGKKIFEGQPEPLSQDVSIADKALSYGEYLFELISSSQEFNKVEPTEENNVRIDCFGTGISGMGDFAMGTKLFNKAADVLKARNAERFKEEKEQRSRIQRTKYEEIMDDILLYEQMDSISDQISNNHHIFGGDDDYTPFENAAKTFKDSLKKDRQHFNEKAFDDMTDAAKEFMRVKANKALIKYNEASYELFISKHAQEDKIALKEAKKLGNEEYLEKKNEIDERNRAEKAKINAKRYNEEAKKQMVERCLSETEYERYKFADNMISLRNVLENNGVINMIENEVELKNENSTMTYNDKSDDLLTIGKAEKIMDMEFNVGKTNNNFILPETELDNIDLEPNELNNTNNDIKLDDFDKGLDESYKISEKKENIKKDQSLLIEEIEDEKEEINIDKKNEDLKAKLGKEFGNIDSSKSKEVKKGDNEPVKEKVKKH